MNTKIIIFGATETEQRFRYYIENQTDDKVSAFCVDAAYKKTELFHDCPVVTYEEVEKIYSPQDYQFLIGIGYKNMNDVRKEKFYAVKQKGYSLYNFIHKDAFVDPSVELGEGNIILAGCLLDYHTTLGNGNIVELGTRIPHECKIGDFNYFASSCSLGGKVHVENNCFFGINTTIRSAATIKQYTLIGAGAYVDRNTEPFSVIVPPRSISLSRSSREMNLLLQGDKKWKKS